MSYFARDVWSENPTEPPDSVAPDDTALAADSRTYTHADMLAVGRRVSEMWGLSDSDGVVLRSSLAHPGTVAAGIVAPILVGGEIVQPSKGTAGEFAVADGDAPELSVTPGEALAGES